MLRVRYRGALLLCAISTEADGLRWTYVCIGVGVQVRVGSGSELV